MLPFLAPLLQQGLSLVANAAMAKGTDWIKEKTGIDIEKPLTDEDKINLTKFQMEHEEELAKIRLEEKKLDIEVVKADAQDRDSARDRESNIATSLNAPFINKIVTPVLALGVVTLTFILFAIIIFIPVDSNGKDILIYVLGALTTAVGQVLSYYFGASHDHKKDVLPGGLK